MITFRVPQQILKPSLEMHWKLFYYKNALKIIYYRNALQLLNVLKLSLTQMISYKMTQQILKASTRIHCQIFD